MEQIGKSQRAKKQNHGPEGSNLPLPFEVALSFLNTQSSILIEIRKSRKKKGRNPIMKQGLVELHLFTVPSQLVVDVIAKTVERFLAIFFFLNP